MRDMSWNIEGRNTVGDVVHYESVRSYASAKSKATKLVRTLSSGVVAVDIEQTMYYSMGGERRSSRRVLETVR